ncbi:tetratricopeptide repeat protein [Paracoccus sp. TK19116]|uniref:Tetratricopeptide repeat protein n=1 Tax=Paracoccus albicereus TaxID=2922394 RepID=A0ABT1MN35_9RHOB|nr:tetratricopeptide repeat protein [Paracoccus albicereus]MCQ0969698.1 tetratricopeptide repeat protein [Paracoccus albicereus]
MKLRLILAATVMLSLAACESSGEKAERYFQSGVELAEAGDTDRAIVELRNVFTYDGEHYEARKLLAELLAERGDVGEAYSQYLRLAEQYPDDAATRRTLATIAIDQGQWEEAERHGNAALQLEPDAPEAADIRLALAYRKAVIDEDAAAQEQAVADAQARIEAEPENALARRILVAEAIESDEPEDALDDLDALIATDPDNLDYAMVKLRILGEREDRSEAHAYLQQLAEKFPDNNEVQMTLVGLQISEGQLDEAEAVLRRLAGPDDGPAEPHLTVIKFLELNKGFDAARDESARLAEANPENAANRQLYQSLQAYYAFNLGDRENSIAIMEQTLEGAEPSDQTNRLRAMLAGMRLQMGERDTATALVQEVLTADPNNVHALRLRAQMELDDDQSTQAINTLRQALSQNPRDTETMLLLAEAYSRAGNRELTGETLASAVDISDRGVPESLRYADFLVSQNRSAARNVITDALQRNPQDIELLMRQGQMALEDQTYPQVEEVIARLESIDEDPRAANAAETLRGAMMLRQGRTDEGLSILEESASGGGDAAAVLSVVRAQVVAGRTAEARTYLDNLLAEDPERQDLRLIDAGLSLTEGNADRSEEILRGLIADHPDMLQAQELLYRQLLQSGRPDEAAATLDAALTANPDARNLLLLRATAQEQAGDIDAAIEGYEALYRANTGDIVVANNLASMLATWRDDPESLTRASAVAQRLKDTRVPAFQDTYGWIAYRNGNASEALTYLQPAAEGLPNDPLVQYHLGMVQAELGRTELARESLTRALQLGEGRDLPQMADAQTALAVLDGGTPTDGGTAGDSAPAADATSVEESTEAGQAEPATATSTSEQSAPATAETEPAVEPAAGN